jgi:hypothetical protein
LAGRYVRSDRSDDRRAWRGLDPGGPSEASLSAISEFYGAGVYAIYYRGDYEHYRPLSGADHPIYVGKADPRNLLAKDAVAQGVKLPADWRTTRRASKRRRRP